MRLPDARRDIAWSSLTCSATRLPSPPSLAAHCVFRLTRIDRRSVPNQSLHDFTSGVTVARMKSGNPPGLLPGFHFIQRRLRRRPNKSRKMKIIGYSDKLSAAPGETISFMVNCELPTYTAEVVRIVCGDTNPQGPGVKEKVVKTPVNNTYKGRKQTIEAGSYVTIPSSPLLENLGS